MSAGAAPRSRIALVGAGRIGSQHAAAVRRSPLLELAAVADPSEAARTAVAGDARAFASVSVLLAAVEVEAVVVAVPSALHGPVMLEVLEAGVPVLCEKPCGLTTETVREMPPSLAPLRCRCRWAIGGDSSPSCASFAIGF